MITELTKEQELELQNEIKRGLEMGLSTGEPLTDLTDIVRLVKQIYTEANESLPKEIIYAASPRDALERLSAFTGKSISKVRDEYTPFYGQHEADFFTRANFYRTIGAELPKTYQAFHDLALLSSWVYFLDEVCVVCAKAVKIVLNEKNEAHNVNGAAIEFADGFSCYVINGVNFYDNEIKFVNTPAAEINVEEVLKIENAQQRTEIVRKVGIEKMIDKLNPVKLDSKFYTGSTLCIEGVAYPILARSYELLKVSLDGYEPFVFLKMNSPTTGQYHLEGVPDDCKTVNDALSFRLFGSLGHTEDEFPTIIT